MDPESSRKEIVRELKRRAAKPISPVVLGSGYAGENVLEGRKIDFLKLPVPQWNATESHQVYRDLAA